MLRVGAVRVGVIAETRIRDLQALLRREHQKQADSGVDMLLLLAADTRHNREALSEANASLRSGFPLGTRAVLMALSHGEAPDASGVVVI